MPAFWSPWPSRLLVRRLALCCGVLLATSAFAQDVTRPAVPSPILTELVVNGSTVFSRDDVMWLLGLELGAPLPGSPADVAEQLRQRYEREGYAVTAVERAFDAGRLTLTVHEQRMDEVEVVGVPADVAQAFKKDLAALEVREGQVYNGRRVTEVTKQLIERAQGALRLGHSRDSARDDIALVERGDKHVLVIPLRQERGHFSITSGTGAREDLFNPVDGFSPIVGFEAIAFDRRGVNHTFVGGYVSYKFAREDAGYSLGLERPLFSAPRFFVGAEIHDLTATDDLWRLSTGEQTLVSFGFKNTFRDYYRRRGTQIHVGLRPGARQEFLVSWRWDRHDPLENATNFSVFRDDQIFRPNAPADARELHAAVLAYTYDSRGLSSASSASFERHLVDDLFRGQRRQSPGWRVDWTTEIGGHGLGGGATFDRHILNARAYVPLSPGQLFAVRVIEGFSGGTLPLERRFAIGGIGTVHGYRFKEQSGAQMTLLNAEYRFGPRSVRGLLFFDAARVGKPNAASSSEWLRGGGAGVQAGPFRLELGYRLDDIPRSRQILLRFTPTF